MTEAAAMKPEPNPLAELTACELRLAIAEAEAEHPRSWKGIWIKRDRIQALTAELLRRGAY
jgi:hypothetical protein